MKDNQEKQQSPSFGHGRHGRAVEKPKNLKKSLFQLFSYLKRYIFIMIVAFLLAVGSSIVTISLPGQLSKMFGIMESNPTNIDLVAIGKIGLTMAIFVGLAAISNYFQGFIMTQVTQMTAKRFRKEINEKINRLPLKYFDQKSYGDVLSRVTNDVDTISMALSQSIISFVYNVSLLIGLIIVMFTSSWRLSLVVVVTIPLSLLLIGVTVGFSQKYFRKLQRSMGDLNGHIEEIYSGHEVVKAFNAEDDAKEKFEKINTQMYKAAYKGNFLSGIMHPSMNFVANIGLVAVCITAGLMILGGNMSGLGNMVAFMIYIRLLNNPMAQLAQITTNMQSAAAASERVFEFLGEQEMESEQGKSPAQIDSFQGKVEFENVKFGYEEGKEVIKNLSLTAKAGQTVAIVGPTGAGKTTIVNLLMRFYDLSSGRIMIDGVSIMDMTRQQVHSLFGMVLQDTWTFDGTIKENIIYAKENISDETVVEAAKIAGVDHIIRALPGGYDMMLDETSSLSAGEKQLITIARAIVENAPMLILDEATSAVDTRTEQLIQQAMDKLTTGKTSFVIAHRLSTIKNADLILVLKDGDIVEQGNHEQLLQRGGFYSELYKSQFEQG